MASTTIKITDNYILFVDSFATIDKNKQPVSFVISFVSTRLYMN